MSPEAIPLGEDEVDAVFSAEAFDWFATREALSEIVRVLRPEVQPDDDRAAFAERLRKLLPRRELRRRVRTVVYWTRLG